KSGCGIDFGPEGRLDLRASYPAKGHAAEWRKLLASAPDGYVDLAASLRPSREAVGYALTFLESPAETKAALALGTSGAFPLCVNGELAASSDSYNYPRPDQSRVSVRLRKGVNRVLLKVCQSTGPFGFFLRREQRAGSARTKVILPDALPGIPSGPKAAPEHLPTIATRLEAEVQKHSGDAALRGEYATALAFFRAYDELLHSATLEAKLAVDAAPSDVSLQLLAAKLQEDDPDLRRQHLEAAVRADPESPHARLQLAQHELSRGHPDRALPILE